MAALGKIPNGGTLRPHFDDLPHISGEAVRGAFVLGQPVASLVAASCFRCADGADCVGGTSGTLLGELESSVYVRIGIDMLLD